MVVLLSKSKLESRNMRHLLSGRLTFGKGTHNYHIFYVFYRIVSMLNQYFDGFYY